MKNYVGRKIRGFKFKNVKDVVVWTLSMKKHIGEVGEIIGETEELVRVQFTSDTWYYPISLIEPHLIEETPEIPQLGEGVLMQVSDNEKDWTEDYIIAKLTNGSFLSRSKLSWKHARPIQQLPKYTHAELVEKLGHDFEYINK
jgi:hypothetical protein